MTEFSENDKLGLIITYRESAHGINNVIIFIVATQGLMQEH
ncbi:hypothetical protein [Streptococcus moroccensis]|nr:hypothetical protein [Streptococcus moroccensis]